MSCPRAFLSYLSLAIVVCVFSASSLAQVGEQLQIGPPLLRTIDPPAPEASVADLERQADQLRAAKLYLDALDYYHAALAKLPNDPRLMNSMGITELQMDRLREARKMFESAIRADDSFANAYNNLGVVLYKEKKYRAAIKEYRKAIAKDDSSASFFNNMGAAYFSKKDFAPAVAAYQHAMELDPDVFDRTSRFGVSAQLPSPEDRARYDYTVAGLYAKMGISDRSLQYLKKAIEEGYKEIGNVYKDVEFSQLRKDPRFTELMSAKTTAIAN